MKGDAGSLPNGGGDGSRIEDLLDSPEWHEKLARAREQREKILAERALTASSVEARRKPWEMPPPERKASRPAPPAFRKLEFGAETAVRTPRQVSPEREAALQKALAALRESARAESLDPKAGPVSAHGDMVENSAADVDGTSNSGVLPELHVEASVSKTPVRKPPVILVAGESAVRDTAPEIVPAETGLAADTSDDWVPDLARSVTAEPQAEARAESVPADDAFVIGEWSPRDGQKNLGAIPVSETLEHLLPETVIAAQGMAQNVPAQGQHRALLAMGFIVVAAVVGAGYAFMPDAVDPVTEQTTAPPAAEGGEAQLGKTPAVRTAAAEQAPAQDMTNGSVAGLAPDAVTAVAEMAAPAPEANTPADLFVAETVANNPSAPDVPVSVEGQHDTALTRIPAGAEFSTMQEVVDISAPVVVAGAEGLAGFASEQGGLVIAGPGAPVERPTISALPGVGASDQAGFAPPQIHASAAVTASPEILPDTAQIVPPAQGDADLAVLPSMATPELSSHPAPEIAVALAISEASPLVTGPATPAAVAPTGDELAAAAPPTEADLPETAPEVVEVIGVIDDPAGSSLAPDASPAPTARPEAPGEAAVMPAIAAGPRATDGLNLDGVVVRMMAPSALPMESLDQTKDLLVTEGFTLSDPKAVDFKISATQVRYYHAQDADAAEVLATLSNATLRDFTGADNPPGPGTLELWFKGTSASAPTPARATAKAAAPKKAATPRRAQPAVDPETALRQKILRQLRNGEHLGTN